ncbi:nucleotide exchange factor GrpE [Aeromicrobium sp. UC242_57]|uniref:nucleotide exchange factor GrpE n=1 Tax=Aeromicrobium sp. UC242_57 TaxID=3374624 RepID=UPI00379559A8
MFHAGESADVDTTTIDNVLRTGYKVGDRVLRPATVGVVDPASPVEVDETPVETAEPVEPVETSNQEN